MFYLTSQFIVLWMAYFYTLKELGWINPSPTLYVFMAIACGSFAFMILFIANLSQNRLFRIALVIICSMFLFSNILHYRYFKEPILLGSIYSAKQLPFVMNYIITLLQQKDFLFLVATLGAIFLFFYGNDQPNPRKTRLTLLCLALLFIGLRFIGGILHSYQSEPGSFKSVLHRSVLNSWDRSDAVKIFGFLPHIAYETSRLATSRKIYVADPLYTPELSADKDKVNIFLIQVESLPTEIIGKKYSGVEATPFLNTLRKESCFFPNINPSHTAGGGTSDADFAVLTSRVPPGNLPAYYSSGLNGIQSLPRILSAEGYTAVVYHANRGGFWGRTKGFKSLGFDQFISKDNFPSSPVETGILPDDAFFDYAFEHMQTLKEPLFAFFITMSSHGPYDKIHYIPFKDLKYSEIDNDLELSNYLSEIKYVDRALSVFVEKLTRTYSNYYIVIFGDHPPLLTSLDLEVNEKIPVFLISSERHCTTTYEQVGSQLDIPVLILDNLGLKPPSSWQGKKLFHASRSKSHP